MVQSVYNSALGGADRQDRSGPAVFQQDRIYPILNRTACRSVGR